MRIAFIIGRFPVPSETFVMSHIKGLIDLGHDVHIFTTKLDKKLLTPQEVDRYQLLKRTFCCPKPDNLGERLLKGIGLSLSCAVSSPRIMSQLLNVVRYKRWAVSLNLLYSAIPVLQRPSNEYDIIHCHFGWNGIVGAMLREIGVIQGCLVTTFHGADMTSAIKRFGVHYYEHLFQNGDLFLPVSEIGRSRLIDLGCAEEKILVHRMGVDCSKFHFAPRYLKETDQEVRLISVSRLVKKKGIEFGIKAVAKLVACFPNIRYQIVGDGPLREELQKLIEDLNVGRWIDLAGWKDRNEIIETLNSSHIALLPSITTDKGEQEGIPVSLMEFMAVGLPVISTFHSGIPELIKDKISGFLVPEGDVEALTCKLRWLIEHPELWQDVGYQARKTIEEQYNNVLLNKKVVAIYEQLIKG